jgi:hypothetical protein
LSLAVKQKGQPPFRFHLKAMGPLHTHNGYYC